MPGYADGSMGPFHPHRRHPPPRTDDKAIVAVVLGLLSIGCAGPVAGVPAIILGSLARRDIDRSSGALSGRGLAAGGIVSGLFGTGIGFVIALSVLGALVAPEDPQPNAVASVPAASAPSPIRADAPPPLLTATPEPTATPDLERIRTYGSLEVVDLDESRPLRAQLGEITRRSRGRTLVLQTFARSSPACVAIEAALPDKRMQGALANVTLIRVDVDEYSAELSRMKVETRKAPWFYKLDGEGAPTDAISADAWAANVPENMAPVLRRFVRRAAPPARRGSVRGAPHDDPWH